MHDPRRPVTGLISSINNAKITEITALQAQQAVLENSGNKCYI